MRRDSMTNRRRRRGIAGEAQLWLRLRAEPLCTFTAWAEAPTLHPQSRRKLALYLDHDHRNHPRPGRRVQGRVLDQDVLRRRRDERVARALMPLQRTNSATASLTPPFRLAQFLLASAGDRRAHQARAPHLVLPKIGDARRRDPDAREARLPRRLGARLLGQRRGHVGLRVQPHGVGRGLVQLRAVADLLREGARGGAERRLARRAAARLPHLLGAQRLVRADQVARRPRAAELDAQRRRRAVARLRLRDVRRARNCGALLTIRRNSAHFSDGHPSHLCTGTRRSPRSSTPTSSRRSAPPTLFPHKTSAPT